MSIATASADDTKVLRYCLGGHEFVGLCDSKPEPEFARGPRRCFVETNTAAHAFGSASPNMTGVTVYQRTRLGFKKVRQAKGTQ
jgi:hypothetical protein